MVKAIKILILLVSIISQISFSQERVNTSGGVLDFNIYPVLSDVDSDSVITINAAAKLLNRFSYFSLTNFYNQSDRGELEDTSGFYTEQNIRWQIKENSPLDLTAQYNLRSGDDNDRLRLGVRWRLNDTQILKDIFQAVSLQWSVNLHALQIDHNSDNAWQIEHAFRLTMPYLSEKLYIAGFIDHTFNEDLTNASPDIPKNPIVAEMQLGYRLLENLYAVTEYRVNQYRRDDVNNVAVGFEYKVKW